MTAINGRDSGGLGVRGSHESGGRYSNGPRVLPLCVVPPGREAYKPVILFDQVSEVPDIFCPASSRDIKPPFKEPGRPFAVLAFAAVSVIAETHSVGFFNRVTEHAIETLCVAQPWRDAILLPWFKDDDLELSPVFDPNEESYASRPLTSSVAFVAATVCPFRHFSTSLTSYPTAPQHPRMPLDRGS